MSIGLQWCFVWQKRGNAFHLKITYLLSRNRHVTVPVQRHTGWEEGTEIHASFHPESAQMWKQFEEKQQKKRSINASTNVQIIGVWRLGSVNSLIGCYLKFYAWVPVDGNTLKASPDHKALPSRKLHLKISVWVGVKYVTRTTRKLAGLTEEKRGTHIILWLYSYLTGVLRSAPQHKTAEQQCETSSKDLFRTDQIHFEITENYILASISK